MKLRKLFIACILFLGHLASFAQEEDLAGFEISIDQDRFADVARGTDSLVNRNYAAGIRIGFYGALADHTYLGLPWVRRKVDGFLVDKLLERGRFIKESRSHNFVLTINGFSPSHISDETVEFAEDFVDGYNHAFDRPFSSFTGFRSSRRLQGRKRFAHSAYEYDLAVTTSFAFGFAGFGLVQGVDNLFRKGRPKADLWDRDNSRPYPTGQVMRAPLPLILYSVLGEAVVAKPLRKVLIQVRPELNVGYYTNLGLGVDIAKVMNVDRHVDNLAYTDTHNPSLVSVNNESIALSIVGGATVRSIFHNAHLQGWFGKSKYHKFTYADLRKFIWEANVGIKIQLLQKVEITWSVNRRSSEFKGPVKRAPLWGTIGLKYLLAPEGEGCFDN